LLFNVGSAVIELDWQDKIFKEESKTGRLIKLFLLQLINSSKFGKEGRLTNELFVHSNDVNEFGSEGRCVN
jgi:hypothetical protein